MKRLLSLIALLLAALCACACAEDAGVSGTIDLSGLAAPDRQFYKSVPKKLLDDDDFIPNTDIDPAALVTRDAVTIDPDLRQYRVVTPEGITLTYTAPEGAYALTQDLRAQKELFERYCTRPEAVVKRWIEDDIRLNIVEPSSATDIYVHLLSTELAARVATRERLSQEDVVALLAFMKEHPGYFRGATRVSTRFFGDRPWFVGDMREADGTVTMVSFVADRELYVHAVIDGDAQYDVLMDEMDRLVVDSMQSPA